MVSLAKQVGWSTYFWSTPSNMVSLTVEHIHGENYNSPNNLQGKVYPLFLELCPHSSLSVSKICILEREWIICRERILEPVTLCADILCVWPSTSKVYSLKIWGIWGQPGEFSPLGKCGFSSNLMILFTLTYFLRISARVVGLLELLVFFCNR